MSAHFFRATFPALLLCFVATSLPAQDWRALAPGLELREFLVPDRVGDVSGETGSMAVLRIDPRRYEVVLGAALASGRPRSVQEWVWHSGFTAAINAGMFRSDDRLRSTGYMRDASVVVNDSIHPNYGAFLAFGPRAPGLPPVRWVDRRTETEWRDVLSSYDGVIQNYRLISPERENLWAPGELRHSAAAVAMDEADHLLFIHCRPRLSMHEFAQALLDLPLDLRGAMYVEGGADAAMYVEVGGVVGRYVGEYKTGFFQTSNTNFWPAPNVLGIRPR